MNEVTGREVAAAMTMITKEVTHGEAVPAKVIGKEVTHNTCQSDR
jgi:hypothetical protein